MAVHVGWRNFWWLNVACLAATFGIGLFGFPETKWHRIHHDGVRTNITSSSPPLEQKATSKVVKTTDPNPWITSEMGINSKGVPDLSYKGTSMRDSFLGKGTPSKQQFKLFQTKAHPIKNILLDLWIPWKLFSFPIVEFASFVVSWSASSFLTLNLTQSQVFAATPYNFSPEIIGFMNFAILIGVALGLVTAGPLSDWVSTRATRKNKGIREPEMRLPTMIPYVLIMIVGNFVVAFGYQHQLDWRVCFCCPKLALKV